MLKCNKKMWLNFCAIFFASFFLSFSFISPSINPFIFSFAIALISNTANFYILSIGLILGLFAKMQTLSSIIISINVVAVLLILKTLLSFKKLKNNPISRYFALIFAQVGFVYFNLYSKTAIISVVVSVIASFLFLFIYNISVKAIKNKNLTGVYSLDEKICVALTFVSICVGLANIDICGFYIIYPLALLIIYFMTLTLSPLTCLQVSTLCALGITLTNNSIQPIAILLVWTIICVLLSKFGKFAVTISLILGDILLGCVFNGYINYNYLNLITTLAPSLVIICIPSAKFRQISMFFGENHTNIAKNYIISQNFNNVSKKLNSLSMLFGDMGQIYKSMLSGNLSEEKLAEFLSQEIRDNLCTNCGFNCNERSVQIGKLKELAQVALNKGKISAADLPSDFTLSCPFLHQIVASINNGVQEYNSFKKKQKEQNSTLVALTESCTGVSSLAAEIAKNINGLVINEKINTGEIIGEFSVNELQIKEVLVLRDDKNPVKKVILIVRRENANNLRYAEILSQVFKMKMVATQIEDTNISGFSAITYDISPKFSVFLGYSQKSKNAKCGDNMLFSQIDEKQWVLALADGMGTGENANAKSNLCLDLLLSFLKLGISTEIMLNSINNLMFKREDSTFSTLDLVEFNAYSGRTDFIKLASSSSFIKRKETCEVIVPESLPLGIVNEVSPTISTKYVGAGDYIILCSDGIVDTFSQDNLQDYINCERTANAQLLAESIVEEAVERGANDDLTCCVLKINNF